MLLLADGFFWYFYQDGSIQHEVKLTGILSTNGLSQGEGPQPDYGVLMAPGLNAQVRSAPAMRSVVCTALRWSRAQILHNFAGSCMTLPH